MAQIASQTNIRIGDYELALELARIEAEDDGEVAAPEGGAPIYGDVRTEEPTG